MKLEIITDPNPILREPAEPVVDFDMSLQQLIDNMVETMREGNGVGLAAPQVGISKQIIVCELDNNIQGESIKKESPYQPFPLTAICNPKITEYSKEKCKMVEGCLSFPGYELVVKRPKTITIEGQDRYGEKIVINADKLYARVMQHEFDHLNSTLLIDHLEEIDTVLFAGGDFALKTLEYLNTDKQYNLKAVVTTSQYATIRGKTDDVNNVKKLARKFGLKVIEAKTLNDKQIKNKIKNLKASLGVVVDFSLIIPKQIIDFFEHGIINIHPSILPKYRGSSPIQATILNGDKYAGVSIILINEQMDAGPIIAQYKVKLNGKENYPILKQYLSELGASLLLDTIPYYLTGEIKPRKQKESRVSYCNTIKKKDGEIFFDTDPVAIDRKVRAYKPWPGVYIQLDGMRVTICSAHIDKEKNLIIDKVKPAGKNEMSYQDFVNGYKTELTFSKKTDSIKTN